MEKEVLPAKIMMRLGFFVAGGHNSDYRRISWRFYSSEAPEGEKGSLFFTITRVGIPDFLFYLVVNVKKLTIPEYLEGREVKNINQQEYLV